MSESSATRRSPKVAVIGGGIAGLSAAFDLHRGGADVTVYEASSRWGGKIWSSPVGDSVVDAGPDTFLARVPDGIDLCTDLGLADELTAPIAPVAAYIHRDGELHTLPAGSVMGVPTDLDLLAESGLISPGGIERAAQDLELPTTTIGDDVSAGAYFRARLGDEVTDRLIDPLLGGINASDIDRLSLRSGAPQLWAVAKKHRSIISGLRETQEERGNTLGSADGPVFHGLPGGIARIIDRLVEELADATLLLNSPITSLDDLPEVDHIIIATPTPTATTLLADRSPYTSELLSAVKYASVAQVTFELNRSDVDPVIDASGILFPRVDGRIMTASTWFSTKWGHYQSDDSVLVRLTSGRFGDGRALAMEDESLASTLLNELRNVISISSEPRHTRVVRWVDSLPQYLTGHEARIQAALESVAITSKNIQLVGAAYHGIGVPACIRSGRRAAAHILEG